MKPLGVCVCGHIIDDKDDYYKHMEEHYLSYVSYESRIFNNAANTLYHVS